MKVELLPLRIGNFMQQINLMLSGNEQLDLLATMGSNMLSIYESQGHLLALDDLLNEYGKDIKELVGEDLLQATTFYGEIKATLPIRGYASGVGLLIRKDILDEYNISVKELQNKVDSTDNLVEKLDVFDSLFAKTKEDRPHLAPVVPTAVGAGVFTMYNDIVPLGNGFGVLMDKGAELEVVNWYATEEYKNILNKAREWYEAGYIMKGAAQNQDSCENLIRAGRGFSSFISAKPGQAENMSTRSGKEMVIVDLIDPYVTTDDLQLAAWTIPRNSRNPEKAMKLLNLMYTDPDIQNLLTYGVEGKHYKLNEKRKVVTFENGGYDMSSMNWILGNRFIQHLLVDEPDDTYKMLKKINEIAFRPKSLGFIFDQSPVRTEVAALTAVTEEYGVALETGVVDPEIVLSQFLGRLEDAGINKVIEEKQRQLDEWAEENNIE
ncbi:MAG TPA: ABC transporter substrate-binding protein [Halanaerobiales bacterium]|nr:ABC transporter substrate-binding protein [Halanaerobiales bacterium]